MIGQSIININSGGRGRLSGITAALCLLIFIVFAPGLIEMIPLAALIGVMFMVVVGTFAWSSLRILHKIPLSDALVLVLVSAVTVFTDLAIAVAVGVIVSALVFAWQNARRIYSDITVDETDTKTYRLNGPLFLARSALSMTNSRQMKTPMKWSSTFAARGSATTRGSKRSAVLRSATWD